MTRKIAMVILAAVAVFMLHARFLIWRAERIAPQWIDIGGESPFRPYISQHDYLLSFSLHTVVAAFTMHSLMRARANLKAGSARVAGGFTLLCFICECGDDSGWNNDDGNHR